jgi:hypothetical protein
MEWKTFGADIVAAVKDYVERAVEPLNTKIAALETDNRKMAAAIASIPEGKPGIDGVGFDDMAAEYDGERTITLRFERGENVKTFSFDMPIVLDRGVWRAREYKAGDAVTWGGSLWIAQKETEAKPDSGEDWRLAVKRGRDARSK